MWRGPIDENVAWYLRKIGTYDKQLWEKSVEERLYKAIHGLHHFPKKSGQVKAELIDVDLVRGSAFTKPKPQFSWLALTRKGIVRLLLSPFYRAWWSEQTSFRFWLMMQVLYCLQVVSLIIYFIEPVHIVKQPTWRLSNVLTPSILMLVLCVLHSQIVSTHARNSDDNSRNKKKSGIKCKRRKSRAPYSTQSEPDSASPETSLEDRARNSLLKQAVDNEKSRRADNKNKSGTSSNNSPPTRSRAVEKSGTTEKKNKKSDSNADVAKAKVRSESSPQSSTDSAGESDSDWFRELSADDVHGQETQSVLVETVGEIIAVNAGDTMFDKELAAVAAAAAGVAAAEPSETGDDVTTSGVNDVNDVNDVNACASTETVVQRDWESGSTSSVKQDSTVEADRTMPVTPEADVEDVSARRRLNASGLRRRKRSNLKVNIDLKGTLAQPKRLDKRADTSTVSSGDSDPETSRHSPMPIRTACIPSPVGLNLTNRGTTNGSGSGDGRQSYTGVGMVAPPPSDGRVLVVPDRDHDNDVGGVGSAQSCRHHAARCRRGGDHTNKTGVVSACISACALGRRMVGDPPLVELSCSAKEGVSGRSASLPSSPTKVPQRHRKFRDAGPAFRHPTVCASCGRPKFASGNPVCRHVCTTGCQKQYCPDCSTLVTDTSQSSDAALSEVEWDRINSDMATSDTSYCISENASSDDEQISCHDDPFSWTLGLQTNSATHNSHTPANDKVSCYIWEGEECKKVDLTVLEIGWTIIRRVEAIPENAEYLVVGLFFTVLLSLVPVVFLAFVFRDQLTLESMSSWLDDVTNWPGLLGHSWPTVILTVNGILQRCCLAFVLFFLLSVVERTFKQRLWYGKHFCHLTSSRRARKYDLPHFRLNKVRNIKTWLSLRSYLKKRGPQRSVDVIVSAAFVLAVTLVAFMCVQLLKDSESFLENIFNWELSCWSLALGIYLLRFMTIGTKINKKYRNLSVLITEQINLYLHMEQKPHKKEELMLANNVLKLSEALLKELESPFKISGLSADPFLYNVTKVVILSAFSAVLTELLGFKLKLYKIKV